LVLADTNIWVSEQLFQSAIGSAFLYAVSRSGSKILLPEIVEQEIGTVLPELAERAVANIRRDMTLLRRLSWPMLGNISVPTALAISEGMKERLDQLSGTLNRRPFTFDDAKAALRRILLKLPPAGENNEQFRDCCIWQAALGEGSSLAGPSCVQR
jgi:PIN domain